MWSPVLPAPEIKWSESQWTWPKTQVILPLQGHLLEKPNVSSRVPAFTGDSKMQQIFSGDFGLDPQPPQEKGLVILQKASPSDRPNTAGTDESTAVTKAHLVPCG